MAVWSILQIVFNLFVFVGMMAFWFRLRRPPQDDPRLSRGLQLLQTKITVLEDLSDRTDNQVKQLTALLDQKTRMMQNKILEAEQQVLKIDHSMNRSLEVAEIFQDKIPHQEIAERQRTVEYVKAARMAHSGLSIEEIVKAVHLPREQVELIAKFNRDQLMFDETQLPEWAQREAGYAEPAAAFGLNEIDFISTGLEKKPEMDKIEKDFKQAVETARAADLAAQKTLMDSKVAETIKASVESGLEGMQPAVMSLKATAQTFREKLVATAEDLLRHQAAAASSNTNTQATGKIQMTTQSQTTDRLGTDHRSPSAAPPVIQHPAGATASANPQRSFSFNPDPHPPSPAESRIINNALNSKPVIKKVVFPRIDKV